MHHTGVVGLARCTVEAPSDMTASIRLAWDDDLVMRVNSGSPVHMGHHYAFREGTVDVALRAGTNDILLRLSNEDGSNHGGWAFCFRCMTPDGQVLLPSVELLSA